MGIVTDSAVSWKPKVVTPLLLVDAHTVCTLHNTLLIIFDVPFSKQPLKLLFIEIHVIYKRYIVMFIV